MLQLSVWLLRKVLGNGYSKMVEYQVYGFSLKTGEKKDEV